MRATHAHSGRILSWDSASDPKTVTDDDDAPVARRRPSSELSTNMSEPSLWRRAGNIYEEGEADVFPELTVAMALLYHAPFVQASPHASATPSKYGEDVLKSRLPGIFAFAPKMRVAL